MAMIGLGRMGGNMVRRLLRGGHETVVYSPVAAEVEALVAEGAIGAGSTGELVEKLGDGPRVVWLMVPAGAATENLVTEMGGQLSSGDVLIDGGNTHFRDDIPRAKRLADRGVHYMDVGTSGGVWGIDRGYCLMAGGSPEGFALIEPLLQTLCPGQGDVEPTQTHSTAHHGYLHCGPSGAGHFVKMVHNGIEYGIMAAYAEGFELMSRADALEEVTGEPYALDSQAISELWRRGSVVGSWLLDLTARALASDQQLSRFTGRVPDSGEGRWTVEAAVDAAVPVHVLSAALFARFRSRVDSSYGDKLLSAMREQFGGHSEAPAPEGSGGAS